MTLLWFTTCRPSRMGYWDTIPDSVTGSHRLQQCAVKTSDALLAARLKESTP